jgi:DNA-binding NarL/FixJ family response regulator
MKSTRKPPPAATINVSLVEDNQLLAEELEKWINATAGMNCVAVYSTAEAALKSLPNSPTHVALVDLRLPGMSGVELIRELKAACPEIQCLVLTMYSESNLIFEAVKAGACGYLLKRSNPAEIADAVRQVYAGGSVMTPRIARKVLETFSRVLPRGNLENPEDFRLTEREKNVLQRMAEGQARKQIADGLEINSHTLDYVIRCIYRKLHVNCIAAAVSVAVREGIVPARRR